MNLLELPESVEANGRTYPIRADFRDVLNAVLALNDPATNEAEKLDDLLAIMLPSYPEISQDDLEELIGQIFLFIDMGEKPKRKQPESEIDEKLNAIDEYKKEYRQSAGLVYWEQDLKILIPAINSVAHCEVRSLPFLHWWTFLGYYLSLPDCLFTQVVGVRSKLRKGKKLEKHEREFYNSNRDLIDRQADETDEEINDTFAQFD